jgi:pimeloyl-ACP methyl ester carboxylesterase
MTMPALVLVHGGEHAADCWDLTVAELGRQEPELRVLAVDLPGHGAEPGDLATATITDWVDCVVSHVDAAGLDEVVVVGHSLAGLTVPGVVAKMGSSRVREMILIAASVPPQGVAIVDTLSGPIAWYARRSARLGKSMSMPPLLARRSFCNGMTRDQRTFSLSRLCPESTAVIMEPADRSDLPAEVPRTWILTLRDKSLSPSNQRRSIAALGGVNTIISLDTCHDAMVSEPRRLAQILIERCRSRERPDRGDRGRDL